MADPYLEWLGIPKHARPVTFYQLLGIAPAETNPQAIEAAAARQTSRVQAFAAGPHAQTAARIVQEIATARAVLLDPTRRAAYDRKLQQAAAAAAHPHAPTPLASAQPRHNPPPGQVAPPGHGTQPPGLAVPAQPYAPAARHVVPAVLSGHVPASHLAALTDPLSQSPAADPLSDPLQAPRRTSRVALLAASIGGGGLAFLALLWLLWTVIAGPASDTTASNQPPGAAGTAPQGGATASAHPPGGSTADAAQQSSRETSGTQQGSAPQGSTPQGSAAGAGQVPLMAERQQFKPLVLRSIPAGAQEAIWVSASGEWAWVGRQLYSLQTGMPVTSTPAPISSIMQRPPFEFIGALAADGSLVAIAAGPWGTSIEVYDCRTGTKISEIAAQNRIGKVEFIAFGPDQALFVIWSQFPDSVLECWDVNQRVRRWQLPCEEVGRTGGVSGVSAAGSTLVICGVNGLSVYDLNEGRAVGRLPLQLNSTLDCVVGVSPINKEIALVVKNHLVVLDEKLQPVLEVPVPRQALATIRRYVLWSPDGQAILVNGRYLVSRSTGKPLWFIEPTSDRSIDRIVHLGPDQLVTIPERTHGEVQVLSSPLATIVRGLEAVESGAAAVVSPRQRVSVSVEVPQALYESAPQTAQAVLERVAQHLASLGIGTDANQPVVLHVVYQEQKVTKTVVDKRKPMNSRERQVTVSMLKVDLTLSWRNRQGDLLQTYWPGRSFSSEDLGLPDVQTAREHLSRVLQSLPVAWFMPQDPNLPVLPLITQ